MKDGIFLTAVKLGARMSGCVDLAATRAIRRLRGERPHRLGGACRLCAKCCESPAVQLHPLAWNTGGLKRLTIWWSRRVNGMELVREVPQHQTLVFRCTHFDEETRRCDSYHSRPLMCRDYPRGLLWESDPPFLKGCGYRAVSPNAGKVAAMIDEQEDLPEETKRRLKEKLHALDGDGE